jgi:uncharacterized NAD(P)/FAD-binding protein YdhS
VRFRPRGGDVETLIVTDWLVNCAGPTLDFLRIDEPLVRDLFGLGLETSRGLQLLRRNGRRNPGLFALGPLTRAPSGRPARCRRSGNRAAPWLGAS